MSTRIDSNYSIFQCENASEAFDPGFVEKSKKSFTIKPKRISKYFMLDLKNREEILK